MTSNQVFKKCQLEKSPWKINHIVTTVLQIFQPNPQRNKKGKCMLWNKLRRVQNTGTCYLGLGWICQEPGLRPIGRHPGSWQTSQSECPLGIVYEFVWFQRPLSVIAILYQVTSRPHYVQCTQLLPTWHRTVMCWNVLCVANQIWQINGLQLKG